MQLTSPPPKRITAVRIVRTPNPILLRSSSWSTENTIDRSILLKLCIGLPVASLCLVFQPRCPYLLEGGLLRKLITVSLSSSKALDARVSGTDSSSKGTLNIVLRESCRSLLVEEVNWVKNMTFFFWEKFRRAFQIPRTSILLPLVVG